MLVRAAKQHSSSPAAHNLEQALSTLAAIQSTLRLQWTRTCGSAHANSANNSSNSNSSSTSSIGPLGNTQPHLQLPDMTTGKPRAPHLLGSGGPLLQQQQPAAGRGMSPSSSTSDMSGCCKLSGHPAAAGDSRMATSGSIKSAKRKAAEALLAARFSCAGSSGSGLQGAAAAAASGRGPVLSFAAATAVGTAGVAAAAAGSLQLQLPCGKRHNTTISLTAVIDRLESGSTNGSSGGGGSSSSSPTAASTLATGALPPPPPQQQQQPRRQQQQQQQRAASLSRLQESLSRLQGASRQVQEQEQEQLRVQWQQEAQRQQPQEEEQQPEQQHDRKKQRLDPEAAAAQRQQQQQQLQLLGQRLQQQHVVVQACGADCSHATINGWCHTPVAVPHIDWARVLGIDLTGQPCFRISQGYEQFTLPSGLQVLVVENQAHLGAALQHLRASMQDPFIAIDLEWRPEFGRRFTPVALMQLASSTVAVLVRTCRMQYRLPPVLRAFLADPAIQLLGFGWASSDEPKMQSTFGLGRKDFGAFVDLQVVAQGLGYCSFGLARLTRAVLGLTLPKSKKISMSNWEAAALSRQQVKYAALDVLVAGQVFRALRLWHSSPSPCEVCHYTLGSADGADASYRCSCGKDFRDVRGYLQHCERAGHTPKWAECSGCGCSRRLPWPSGGGGSGAGAGGAASEGSGASGDESGDESGDGGGA